MRLLIIDDNQEIVDYLVPRLKKETFAVDSALEGNQGLYLAQTNSYDLIILDNTLPGKSGLEICYTLREEKATVPILLLSIKGEVEEKIKLLEAGADDYLTKPFSYPELISRVRALLRRPPLILATYLTCGNIHINSSTQEVKINNTLIHLTPKEFSLLELLIKHKNTVVSRGMILEHVWDINGDPFSKTIETHILNLRKKIDTGKTSVIISVPGRGYKIVGE